MATMIRSISCPLPTTNSASFRLIARYVCEISAISRAVASGSIRYLHHSPSPRPRGSQEQQRKEEELNTICCLYHLKYFADSLCIPRAGVHLVDKDGPVRSNEVLYETVVVPGLIGLQHRIDENAGVGQDHNPSLPDLLFRHDRELAHDLIGIDPFIPVFINPAQQGCHEQRFPAVKGSRAVQYELHRAGRDTPVGPPVYHYGIRVCVLPVDAGKVSFKDRNPAAKTAQ